MQTEYGKKYEDMHTDEDLELLREEILSESRWKIVQPTYPQGLRFLHFVYSEADLFYSEAGKQ